MHDPKILTPEEAESVVDCLLESFGLDSLPKVRVTRLADGLWKVHWDDIEHVTVPMDETRWRAWLEAHVGPLDPELLATTEG